MKILAALCLWGVIWCNAIAAPVTIYKFDSKENEAIFYKLSDELRCLVCQNQNIAESNSELAQDLKQQIYTMLRDGKSEDEIIEFMVERYGDYVLFDPPFKPLTWLLWLGPLMLFFLALVVGMKAIGGHRSEKTNDAQYSSDDAERLDRLKSELNQSSDKDKV